MIFQPFHCDELIRLGKNNDGGYLVNKQDVLKSTKLLSLGIGEDCSFEEAFTQINDCRCVACDASARDLPFFKDKHQLIKLNVNKNVFLKDLIEPQDRNVFIKCDIDGDEYGLLPELIGMADQLSGLVIEFHQISDTDNINALTSFISKIGHKLVHAHVNNYFYYKIGEDQFMVDTMELTFTSSSNVSLDQKLALPHRLDMPNNPLDTEFAVHF
jgi:hypothetical protein